MELLLYRWSTAVQITSDVMIAAFFVALALSLRRSELRPWVGAWLANLAALLVSTLFWLLQPTPAWAFPIAVASYVFAKTLFLVLLLHGARALMRLPSLRPLGTRVFVAVIGLALAVGATVQTIPQLGLVQSSVIALGLGWGAVYVARYRLPHFGWLTIGFGLRALLAVAAAIAYGSQWLGGPLADWALLPVYLASHSSFDMGAEWMIVLGCVLTIHGAIQRELQDSNTELHMTQQRLRDLLDRDQLTSVYNRRALPGLLENASAAGAILLFVDLDRFKLINDAHGHHVGDVCLQRIARALQHAFPSPSRVVRYAGDEFIVITRLDADGIEAAFGATRQHLARHRGGGPAVAFSVGMSTLEPGGDPQEVLRAADAAMYAAKRYESRRAPTVR